MDTQQSAGPAAFIDALRMMKQCSEVLDRYSSRGLLVSQRLRRKFTRVVQWVASHLLQCDERGALFYWFRGTIQGLRESIGRCLSEFRSCVFVNLRLAVSADKIYNNQATHTVCLVNITLRTADAWPESAVSIGPFLRRVKTQQFSCKPCRHHQLISRR